MIQRCPPRAGGKWVGAQLTCVYLPSHVCDYVKHTKEQKQRKKEGRRALNNVILGRGNTRAREDLHFPQVEATVDVHLVILVLRKIEKKTIILLLTDTQRASSEVPGRGPTDPVSFFRGKNPLQWGISMEPGAKTRSLEPPGPFCG